MFPNFSLFSSKWIATSIVIFFCSIFHLFSQQHDINQKQFYSSLEPHRTLHVSSNNRIDSLYKAYLLEHKITEDNGVFEAFIYDYNYFLEKLNKSGKVFSGDELSVYLNKMKDELLVNHPKKNAINVYLANFEELNAFTNDFGSIYVNVATIAKVDSEMELRVILAHEIAHVLMRHSFKMANLDNHLSGNEIERINEISDFDSHQFSQIQELEADSMAYGLLKDLGYNISQLQDLFHKLNSSRDPVFSDVIHLDELSLDRTDVHVDYLNRIHSIMRSKELFSEIKDDDSLSTHPSAEARQQLYERVVGNLSDNFNPREQVNDNFEGYRLMAANVLSKTLMTEHNYIEGLYLVMQLRKKFPDDEELLKRFLKLQVLIMQSKYIQEESSILNIYGSSCTDSNYMLFRRGILSIPPLEMNIMCISNLDATMKISQDAYLDRLMDLSYQFLYKHNPEIISKVNGNLVLSITMISTRNPAKRQLKNSFQEERYKEIASEGYLLVDTLYRDMILLNAFVDDFVAYDEFTRSLYKYRTTRDVFESMLTIDEFIVNYDPDESYKDYHQGEHSRFRSIPDSAVTALVQADTYVYTRVRDGIELDVKRTLEVEEMITTVLQEGNYFTKDLTNLNSENEKTSVRDNYMHYLLTNWIGECLNFEDLTYSVADEEIMEYLTSSNTQYLVYNFNILKKNKRNKGYRCLYYNLYFDLKTMGVAYVSKIATSKKPKEKYLKHYFYHAHTGKTEI